MPPLQNQEPDHDHAQPSRPIEEWMLICQRNTDLQPHADSQPDVDWTHAAQSYPNLEEAPSFISQQRQTPGHRVFTTTASPANLQGKQQQVYTTVQQHYTTIDPPPLRIIVSGTAGTGKSYLIHCLRLLLQHQLQVAAPTGVAAFNVEVSHFTPSSAYLLGVISKTSRESVSPSCSNHSQGSSTSSSMRCPW